MVESLYLLLIHSVLCSLVAVCGQLSPSQTFHFVNEPRSWGGARSHCREKYSDLAAPGSMEAMSRLQQSVEPKHQGDVWIGLKGRDIRPWRWLWSGTGALQYSHWQSGEPNGDGLCVQTRGQTGWFDVECQSNTFFVCYSEHRSPSYVLVEREATWLGAQSYCKTHYTDLAIIESQADQEQVLNLTKGGNVWVGLFRDLWEWVDQGNSSFRYWASETEMASEGDDCVAVRTTEEGRWYRHACSVTHPFVCVAEQSAIKRQFVRLTISAKDGVDLNNPTVKAAVLEQIRAELKAQGVSAEVKLRGREDEDGGVFTARKGRSTRRGEREADEL